MNPDVVAAIPYLHVLVGHLLPFLGHGLWCWTGTVTDSTENEGGGAKAIGNDLHDLPFILWVGESPRAVGAESDPVCYL